GGERIVSESNVLRRAVRYRSGKRLKRFDLAHQQVRLPLKLLPLRRQAQAAPLPQEQSIAQPILKEIDQIPQGSTIFAEFTSRLHQAAVFSDGSERLKLGKGIDQ